MCIPSDPNARMRPYYRGRLDSSACATSSPFSRRQLLGLRSGVRSAAHVWPVRPAGWRTGSSGQQLRVSPGCSCRRVLGAVSRLLMTLTPRTRDLLIRLPSARTTNAARPPVTRGGHHAHPPTRSVCARGYCRHRIGRVFQFVSSDAVPASPDVAGSQPNNVAAGPRSLPGTYTLSFVDTTLQPVTTFPVCDGELLLKAHVEVQVSHAPAQGGAVVFEYCSYGGVPKDITRADEAPMEACQAGEARWRRLGMESVNESGDAYWFFGAVRIPRTVGFRFEYLERNSGIVYGIGGPANFTWGPGTCL
jgi:hypothetical protein